MVPGESSKEECGSTTQHAKLMQQRSGDRAGGARNGAGRIAVSGNSTLEALRLPLDQRQQSSYTGRRLK